MHNFFDCVILFPDFVVVVFWVHVLFLLFFTFFTELCFPTFATVLFDPLYFLHLLKRW